MKLLIAGSRGYTNYAEAEKRILKLLKDKTLKNVTIIEGGARGADRIGRDFAIAHQLPYKTVRADWNKYGKQAGYLRNAEMAKMATAAIIFWDGSSPGSKHMIDLLTEYNVRHVVIRIKINKVAEHEHTPENNRSS